MRPVLNLASLGKTHTSRYAPSTGCLPPKIGKGWCEIWSPRQYPRVQSSHWQFWLINLHGGTTINKAPVKTFVLWLLQTHADSMQPPLFHRPVTRRDRTEVNSLMFSINTHNDLLHTYFICAPSYTSGCYTNRQQRLGEIKNVPGLENGTWQRGYNNGY